MCLSTIAGWMTRIRLFCAKSTGNSSKYRHYRSFAVVVFILRMIGGRVGWITPIDMFAYMQTKMPNKLIIC